jgi:Rrp15p
MAAAIIPIALQAFETLEPIAQKGVLALFNKIHKKQATAADLLAEAEAIVGPAPAPPAAG